LPHSHWLCHLAIALSLVAFRLFAERDVNDEELGESIFVFFLINQTLFTQVPSPSSPPSPQSAKHPAYAT
jgi:hypothetical protein